MRSAAGERALHFLSGARSLVRVEKRGLDEQLRRIESPAAALATGVIYEDEEFRVRTVTLDHRTPCLGFALEQRLRINVWNLG